MQNFVIQIMNQYGNLGIALLIAIENIFPPIPSEVILSFGGFMTTYTKLTVVGVIIASTIGSLIGAVVLYGVGRLLNKERLIAICNSRVGQLLHLKSQDIEKSEEWFVSKSKGAVLFCRCIPIVRSLISIPAGMSKMNFMEFMVLTTIGTVIWNTAITLLGRLAGNSWEIVSNGLSEYSHILIIGAILLCLIIMFRKKISRKIVCFIDKCQNLYTYIFIVNIVC